MAQVAQLAQTPPSRVVHQRQCLYPRQVVVRWQELTKWAQLVTTQGTLASELTANPVSWDYANFPPAAAPPTDGFQCGPLLYLQMTGFRDRAGLQNIGIGADYHSSTYYEVSGYRASFSLTFQRSGAQLVVCRTSNFGQSVRCVIDK